MKHSTNQFRKLFLQINLTVILIFLLSSTLKAQTHLLLSEIVLQPAAAEFIEIYNPTSSTIQLGNYYLTDSQIYPYLSTGLPEATLGDFIVQFPQGAVIASKEAIVVAVYGTDFDNYYGEKADYEINDEDTETANMIIITEISSSLSNAGEGIALFYWDGVDEVVQDVDLMNAGIPTTDSEIVDKTDIPGYLPDAHTIPYQNQNGPPGDGFSTKRILIEEEYETLTGGNGITGHDETSEDISITWDEVYTAPTPGITELILIGVETVLGSANTLRVYPNPSSSEINLVVDTKAEKYTIKIINSQGAIVDAIKYINEIDRSIKINTSKFESGVYFIMFQSYNEIAVQRVVFLN